MSEERTAFIESEFIKSVNQTAERMFSLKQSGSIEYKTEQNKLAKLIIDNAGKYIPKNVNSSDYMSCVHDVIIYSIKKWQPGNYGFWGLYKSTFDKRVKDIYNDKHASYISIDDPDEYGRIQEIPDNSNLEENALQPDYISFALDIINEILMESKAKYRNSKKVNYVPYFCSEYVTQRIHESDDPTVFKRSEDKLMEIIDHDFVSYYMDGGNNSLAEIADGSLKKLSLFSEDPNDDKPCGYQICNIVYAKYVSQIKDKDKLQSESSITQQRNKFNILMKSEYIKKSNN